MPRRFLTGGRPVWDAAKVAKLRNAYSLAGKQGCLEAFPEIKPPALRHALVRYVLSPAGNGEAPREISRAEVRARLSAIPLSQVLDELAYLLHGVL